MLQAGSIVDLMLGSNFSNPGFLNSNPGVIQSFVSGGNTKGNPGVNGQFMKADDFIYNDSMLEMLRNWTLTQSILSIFKTSILDVYTSSEIKVETGVEEVDKDVNKFIKSIGLINNLMENLEDDMYYGQRAFYLDHESESIINLSNSRNFDQVRYLGKPFKYRFNSTEESGKKTLFEYKKICSIIFNAKLIGSSKSDKPILSSEKEIDNLLCDLEYYRGQSVLKNVLYLIFQHFLKSLLSSLLSIKNTVKPDLLKAEIQPGTNQEINITEAINNIEALLNNGDYTFDFRTSNASSIVSTIYNAIVNSVKVVPGLSNYTNFDLIQQPDATAKIEALNRDIGDLQNQILNLVGIPEELYGGSGNRWEVIQRSLRYQSIIKSFIFIINNTIRQVAKSRIYTKFGKDVVIDSININLGIYNSLFASDSTNKIQVLNDSLQKISELLNNINTFKSNELCNIDEAAKYISNYISAIDVGLSKLIDINKFKAKPSPSSEGDGGEGGW